MTTVNITVGEYDESESPKYPPIPEAIYECVISWWGEPKINSKNTGSFTPVIYDVVDGQYGGRKIFEHLNLTHDNPKAVLIAKNTQNAILLSAGCSVNQILQDSNEIEGRQLKIGISYDENGNQKRKYIKPDPTQAYGDKAQTLKETTPTVEEEFGDVPF